MAAGNAEANANALPSFPSVSVPVFAEEGSSVLLRMCPGVRAAVCVIFGLEDSSSHVAVEPVTGGLSNFLFKVAATPQNPRLSAPALVRVFGPLALDRDRENQMFTVVAAAGIGPRLLATFANGRVEEFLQGFCTLEPEEFLGRTCGPVVAERLARLHSLELARAAEEAAGSVLVQQGESAIWPQLEQWLEDALRRDFPQRKAQQRAEIQQVLAAVKVDLCRWKALFSSTNDCRPRGITHGLADRFWGHLRLCHNDLHGIVLLLCLLLPSSIFFA